jgi:hypothetical protein
MPSSFNMVVGPHDFQKEAQRVINLQNFQIFVMSTKSTSLKQLKKSYILSSDNYSETA